MAQEHDLDLDDLANPAQIEDPYPFYQRLRATDPVRWNARFNSWVLTRYADVTAAFEDLRLSSRQWGEGRHPFPRPLTEEEQSSARHVLGHLLGFMQGMDPPEHTRQRALVQKAFSPRMLERQRASIQQIVDAQLDAVEAKGHFEVMADLARPLPFRVIMALLGVPAEAEAIMLATAAVITQALSRVNPPPERWAEMARTVHASNAYFESLVAERRQAPGADLLSALVTVEEGGERLSTGELNSFCTMLIFAGHETTTGLIGNGLLALLRSPDARARLMADPSLMGPAIEELLRYDTPVQAISRVSTADVELGGKRITSGQRVMALLGAANRDPAQFADPDRLDLGRRGRAISFGHGIHYCVGAALARMEAQSAMSTVLRRFPGLQLLPEQIEWRPNFVLRGLKRFPLTLSPA